MPVEPRRDGDELRSRERLHVCAPFGPDEQAALGKMMEEIAAEGPYSFDKDVEICEAWARETLRDAGLPEDGSQPAPGGGASYPEYPNPAWFAARIVDELAFTRNLIEEGNATEAVRFALRLGRRIQEAQDRFDWGKEAKQKRRDAARLRQGASEANQERKKSRDSERTKWKAEAEKIRGHGHLKTKVAIATAVKKNLGLEESVDTIRRHI